MGKKEILILLKEHLKLAEASAAVLRESYDRAALIWKNSQNNLSIEQRETLEALTARFSRFSDFLVQRLFRTLEEYELTNEGTLLDRLNRFEKRGIISSAQSWREIRELRNEIAHEYLIEKSDRVVKESFDRAPELFAALEKFKEYLAEKKVAL